MPGRIRQTDVECSLKSMFGCVSIWHFESSSSSNSGGGNNNNNGSRSSGMIGGGVIAGTIWIALSHG